MSARDKKKADKKKATTVSITTVDHPGNGVMANVLILGPVPLEVAHEISKLVLAEASKRLDAVLLAGAREEARGDDRV